VRLLLVTASVVPSSPILVALMMEALSSSETLVLTRATRRNIPEDAILYDVQVYSTLFLKDGSWRILFWPVWLKAHDCNELHDVILKRFQEDQYLTIYR
jgi:hypothetical protein